MPPIAITDDDHDDDDDSAGLLWTIVVCFFSGVKCAVFQVAPDGLLAAQYERGLTQLGLRL